jgi:hypothetical protein
LVAQKSTLPSSSRQVPFRPSDPSSAGSQGPPPGQWNKGVVKGWSNVRSYFSFVVSAICYPLLSQMTDLDKESIAIVADIHGTNSLSIDGLSYSG